MRKTPFPSFPVERVWCSDNIAPFGLLRPAETIRRNFAAKAQTSKGVLRFAFCSDKDFLRDPASAEYAVPPEPVFWTKSVFFRRLCAKEIQIKSL
ncbi:MAG: hypothetical protein LIO54_08015 [Oscillospiraceae bacterium]|nr:hypothetical protein [Oscillospiraceae bacterium]